MNTTKQQMSIDKQLSVGYKETGDRERYCLENLFKYMNLKQDTYEYHFVSTPSGIAICYDGELTIRYKATGTIISYHLIEAKCRMKDFDELILEKTKFNALKKEKNKKDKYLKSQWSDKIVGMIYIQFTPSGSYLFDLLSLYENNLLPTLTKMNMNKVTIASTTDKVEKQIYLLNKELGSKYGWIYNEQEYNVSLLESVKQNIDTVIKQIKTTYSIF